MAYLPTFVAGPLPGYSYTPYTVYGPLAQAATLTYPGMAYASQPYPNGSPYPNAESVQPLRTASSTVPRSNETFTHKSTNPLDDMRPVEHWGRGHVAKLSDQELKQIKKVLGERKYKYRVVKSLSHGQHTVPVGFLCDGASAVAVDWVDAEGWLTHDWLYATHPVNKWGADKELIWWRKYAMHFGPVTGLASERAWARSGSRGPEFLKVDGTGRKYLEYNHGKSVKYI